MLNMRYLATAMLIFCLSFTASAQDNNDNAKNQRMATTSGGWLSGGIYTSRISVGQNGVSTLLTATDGQTDYKGNFGFILPLIEQVEPNQAPVAVTSTKSTFYNLGDVLRLNGFDPDGDEIQYIITQQPEFGNLTKSGLTAGRYTYTPSEDLTPAKGYEDTVRFKVAEVGGEMLESEVAILPFVFNVEDVTHEITALSVTSTSESTKSLNITMDDPRINNNYAINISYLDRTNGNVFVNVIDDTYPLSAFDREGNTLSIAIGVSTSEYPYLFETDQVLTEVIVTTPATNLQSDGLFVIENNSSTGGDGNARDIGIDRDFFTQNGDNTKDLLETDTSEDGQFFSYSSEKQTPENTPVAVKLYAIDFGDFSLENATIQITGQPENGSITEPVLSSTSDNLAEWTVFYTPQGDVGYNDSFDFTVTSSERDESVRSSAAIQVVDVNDPPTLSSIANQLIDEEEVSTLNLSFGDVDSELTVTATSSDASNVQVSTNGSELTITPATDYSGTVSVTVLVEEVDTDEAYSKFETFEIEVAPVNDSPVMAAIDNQNVDEDNVFTYTLAATDVDATVPLFTYSATSDIQGAATVSINGNILTVTPAENYNGTINFSVTANDRLGTSTSTSAVENFSLVVNAVNDAPESTATIPDQSILDVLPSYVLDMGLYFEDVETADADLTITNDATGNFFTLATSGDNVTVTPIQGQAGSEDVTFTVSDGELSVSQTVTFTVTASSSDLTAGTINDVSVDEDFSNFTVDLSGVFTDSGDPNASFTYTVGGLSNLSASTNGDDLILNTSENFNGSESVFLIASANGKSTFTTFDITVNPVNDGPSLGTASNQSIQEDGQFTGLFVTFEDIDTDAADLTFTATSSNESLIANSDIAITKGSSGVSLAANTVANASGTATITLTVSDGEFESSQSFNVTVLSVNDVPTVATTTIADATEDAGYSQTLSGLFEDVDGDQLTYILDNNPDWLSIDNGSLTGTPLNEDVRPLTFYITANDGSGGTVRQEYSINVVNTNDAPSIANPASDITATEDVLLSSLIGASVFEDVDGDDLTLSASFSGADWLSFDPNTNRFSGTPTNDDVGTVNISVTATDPDGATVTDDLVLTVVNTNDSPIDLVLSASALDENSVVGTNLASLSTSDVDAGDTFTYTLVSGEGDTNNDLFEISNGSLVTKGEIDFESNATLSVRVQTEDAAGARFSKIFTITVNDVNEAPTALDLSTLSIAENAGADVEIGTLSSTDADANDSFSYTLVNGTGDDDNSSFEISNGGLVAKSSFNFESKSSYSVRLKTEDAGGLSYEEALTINVTDANDAPTAIAIDSDAVEENTDQGTVIGALSTTDEDANDSFTYSLATGADDNDFFSIDGANLVTASSLNFEEKSAYTVSVTTTDAAGASFVSSISIDVTDVNDAPSDIAIDVNTVAENSEIGTVVGALSTSDDDSGDTFTYSLADGAGDNASFDLDGTNIITAAEIDFETKSSYSVEVTTTDAAGASFTKSIIIDVTNVAEPSIAAIADLSFDITDIAETSTQSFTIENTGDTEIEVTEIVLPEAYSVASTNFTVAVGESTDVVVTFSPSEARSYSGEIVMQSTVGETRISVVGEGTIVTAIEDDVLQTDDVSLYPNPASQIVTIDLSEIPQLQPDLAIIDLSGTSVWTKSQMKEEKVEVDISNYPAGTYLIRIASEKGSIMKKLLIVK